MTNRELKIEQAEIMSDEEALLEAQAWGFDTVADFLKALTEASDQYELDRIE